MNMEGPRMDAVDVSRYGDPSSEINLACEGTGEATLDLKSSMGNDTRVWCGAKPRGAKPLLEGKYYFRMNPADAHYLLAD